MAQFQRSRTEPAGRAGAGAQQRPGGGGHQVAARAVPAGLADDKLIPQPGLTANTSRLRNLRGDRGSASKYGVELNVQYEVDLWGKLSRQSDAAQWEALATEQDRQSAALSLVGTTATLYWQTGFINQRIATSLESIAAARKTQELVRAQYAAGGASALEVAEAAQTVASRSRPMPCWCNNGWSM